ncbi:MAG: DUF1631 family protein [Pseudomonadota bacterium]
MATSPPSSRPVPLGRAAREHFLAHLEGVLAPLGDAIHARLRELMDQSSSGRESQERRDALLDFDKNRNAWISGTQRAWRGALVPATATSRVRLDTANLELIGDDVVENKILASRLALAIQEKAVWDFNDLKLRIRHVDREDELDSGDILRSETIAQLMLEQWIASGMSREAWTLVRDVIQQQMVERLVAGYRATNEFLVQHNVLRDIDLSTARVRRSAGSRSSGGSGARRSPGAPAAGGPASDAAPLGPSGGGGASGPGGFASSQPPAGWGSGGGGDAGPGGGFAGGGGMGSGGGPAGGSMGGPAGMGAGGGRGAGAMTGPGPAGYASQVADETRMMTSTTPLARARARASGVLGQLKRLLSDKVAGFDPQHVTRPSPDLAEAMAHHATQVQTQVQTRAQGQASPSDVMVYDNEDVHQVARDLRQRTGELKRKAATSTEKATIEIVALMFQSILSEERIPPAVRVWFARLQMPVLRVAIAEPEFFGSLEHPARQLIDRMGSCVLGFDSVTISGSALEVEIKRVVQVIEQYPETGRRVFQLVYDEFQKFLSRYLTEKGPTQQLVSVAQQVEQKETMAIQYTIELRKMLADMPVRDEIREFLFKVWAEALAIAAIKHGPQHAETIALKKSAADLVWAASAKPNRNDRARVINDLPQLLQRLRQGMTLLGLQPAAQEVHIKVIGDTLADAFLSKTEAISPALIEDMTKRLANLEDFVSDDTTADLPLDKDSIELMLGIDATLIEVLGDAGSQPNAAMQAWAQELQVGTWFTLDHNGKTTQVQYAWRSDRRQLHLLASPDGRSYLVQLRRLASYLQAGLLVPTEEEALTVRATRDALAKLDANPERLLQ